MSFKIYIMFIVINRLMHVCVQCVDVRKFLERKRSELNPEIFFNSTELLQKYYYSTESHFVYTEDGYMLNIFRVPRNGPPVLLVHGIGDSSDGWVVLGPKYSLTYLLADAGYDVWLFNCRGNKYSKEHTRSITREDYFNFSFEEIGTYDLSATIDYILSRTGRSQITYIGYSQGGTTFFTLCTLRPEYNYKINHAILLAPVAWMANVQHPFVSLASKNINVLSSFLKKRKIYELANASEISVLYHATVCNISLQINTLCTLEIASIFGLNDLKDLVSERLPIITTHMLSGFSTKTLIHYLQLVNSKRFCRYDYGKEGNERIYSSSTPPDYDVSLVNISMTMFVSEPDWFASPADVKILRSHLKIKVRYITIEEAVKFTHLEFIHGSRINSIVNKPILEILQRLWQG